MRILITGALGHIGSRLIRSLGKVSSTYELVLLDNLSTQRYFSLFHLPEEGNFSFYEVDLSKENINLQDLIGKVEVVIHLAAMTDATNSFEAEEKISFHNLEITKRVVQYCSQLEIPLIFTSSTSIYGGKRKEILEEDSQDIPEPKSPYAKTKLAEEKYIKNESQKWGFPFCIFRFGTIYGVSPGMRFHTAVNRFCWQATLGKPISVWKTALDQNRPYLDLQDAVQGFLFVIEKRIWNQAVYNLSTATHTVREILDVLREQLGDINYELIEAKAMNLDDFSVSTKKIESYGFSFLGNLSTGIEETLSWIQKIRSRNKKILLPRD